MKIVSIALAAAGAAALSGCATTAAPGPVEVTRFVRPELQAQLGSGTIFVENAPGIDASSLEMAPFDAAVAHNLVRLGYSEAPRARAGQIAQVTMEQQVGQPQPSRSPVSVGLGGSTGSYGSGMGLGIGINLGKKKRSNLTTRLSVSIRDAAKGTVLWEGRALFSVSDGSPLAANSAAAATIADALFRDFPGNNGETLQVRVSK